MSKTPALKKTTAKPRRISARLSLSELVQMHLERNRMRAAALCRKSKLLPSILSKVLSGKQRYLDTETVLKLSKAMGVTEAVLFRAMRNTKSAHVNKSEVETCIDRSKSLHHNI